MVRGVSPLPRQLRPRSLTLRTFMNRDLFCAMALQVVRAAVSLVVNLGGTNLACQYCGVKALTSWEQNSKPLCLPAGEGITLQPPGMAGIHRRNSCTFIGTPPHTRSCVFQKCFFQHSESDSPHLSLFPPFSSHPIPGRIPWTYSWLLSPYLCSHCFLSLRCYSLSWPFCPPEFYHCSSSSLPP